MGFRRALDVKSRADFLSISVRFSWSAWTALQMVIVGKKRELYLRDQQDSFGIRSAPRPENSRKTDLAACCRLPAALSVVPH
jgi:hypothetical protein